MKASKIGVLQQVVDDQIQIDNNWYNGANIKQYIPKEMDIQVEYNEDGNGNLIYVRSQTAFTPKSTGGKFSEKKGGYTPYKSTYVDKSGSICKQTLMKLAGVLVSNGTYGSVEEALETLDKTYNILKEKYLEEIKSN